MNPRLAHLGIAIEDTEEALLFWRDLLGMPLEHSEHVEVDGVTVTMLRLGEGSGAVELLTPDPGENPVRRFLDKRGAGLHHVALFVEDLPGLLSRLQEAEVALVDNQPREGAHGTSVAFVHPKSTGGVLVELVQE